jgi:hypothetical protein
LTSLVKKLEEITAKGSSNKAAAFVIILAEDQEKAEKDLKALAEKENLTHVILAVESPAGPPKYNLAKEADVTVIVYEKKKVKTNRAFEKGKLTSKEVDELATSVKEALGVN